MAPQEARDTQDNADYRPTVLLVEDNKISAKAALMLLNELGCDVDYAEDGQMALEFTTEKAYDMIFMDIGLPDMDGLEVTKRIRAYHQMPIVALTAQGELSQDSCQDVGIIEIIEKPLDKAKAQKTLDFYVTKTLNSHSVARPVVLDLEYGIDLVNGDKDAAYEMLAILAEDVPGDIDQIKSFAQAEDKGQLCFALHRLRSAVLYCGVPRLQHALKDLCSKSIKARSIEEIEGDLQGLYDEVDMVLAAYRALPR
ncbi:MAG: hypothetical protein CMF50_02760 [Legionellales bacterium]|nr:hypothetical protein [Legionellales bacterium]|tara:strand:- start:1831 stop:2592 length:762 start_codon:yes stop_codon:yes gene_type:complete